MFLGQEAESVLVPYHLLSGIHLKYSLTSLFYFCSNKNHFLRVILITKQKRCIMNSSVVKIAPTELENFFLKESVLLRYKKGETILRAYDSPPGVFCIKSGYVRVYSISEQGEEITLIIFKPGDSFPLVWAINNMENFYNVEAMTDVEIWRAPKDRFLKFIKENPEVTVLLMRRVITRLGASLMRMEQLVFGGAYAKIASILFLCGERFGKKRKEGTVIQVPLTHKDIGSLVGLTRETTSIEMKRLERKGIISHQKGLIAIKSLKLLKEESSSGGPHA